MWRYLEPLFLLAHICTHLKQTRATESSDLQFLAMKRMGVPTDCEEHKVVEWGSGETFNIQSSRFQLICKLQQFAPFFFPTLICIARTQQTNTSRRLRINIFAQDSSKASEIYWPFDCFWLVEDGRYTRSCCCWIGWFKRLNAASTAAQKDDVLLKRLFLLSRNQR